MFLSSTERAFELKRHASRVGSNIVSIKSDTKHDDDEPQLPQKRRRLERSMKNIDVKDPASNYPMKKEGRGISVSNYNSSSPSLSQSKWDSSYLKKDTVEGASYQRYKYDDYDKIKIKEEVDLSKKMDNTLNRATGLHKMKGISAISDQHVTKRHERHVDRDTFRYNKIAAAEDYIPLSGAKPIISIQNQPPSINKRNKKRVRRYIANNIFFTISLHYTNMIFFLYSFHCVIILYFTYLIIF